MKKRSKAGAERRRYPRIKKKLDFRVAADGYRFVTTTKDISCIGAYCHIDKYIPPFTKVALGLAMPVKNSHSDGKVSCQGVIVRTEDERQGGGFNIAIFFNQINESQRKKIASYVNRFLPPAPPKK
ncbi:MAG: PilZ domain-containing protein [Candidatus Omnitrophota bacterium]